MRETRTERRKRERIESKLKKKTNKNVVGGGIGKRNSSLFKATTGFFFVCFSYSIGLPARAWKSESFIPETISYLALIGVFILSFIYFAKNYPRMKNSWRFSWATGMISGFVLSVLFINGIFYLNNDIKTRNTLKKHGSFISLVSKLPLNPLNEEECENLTVKQNNFHEYLWNNDYPPTAEEIFYEIKNEEKLYVLGCNAWSNMDNNVSMNVEKFKDEYFLAGNVADSSLKEYWPAKDYGCQMEVFRNKNMGSNRESVDLLKKSCENLEFEKHEPWIPGMFQKRVEELLNVEF